MRGAEKEWHVCFLRVCDRLGLLGHKTGMLQKFKNLLGFDRSVSIYGREIELCATLT